MLIRSSIVIAGALSSFFLGASFAQEPPPKASVEGVIAQAGTGTPLAGARVTLTLSPQRGAGARGFGAGQIPPGMADNPELLQALMAAQAQGGVVSPDTGVPLPPGGRGPGGRGARPVPISPATTDEQGRFSFANIDPGTYRLQVQANGHVPQEYGQRFSGGPGTPITVIAGQAKSDVSVVLVPAGNVSGTLRDGAGQPVPNVAVQLLRPLYNANGTRSLQPAGGAKTDDRGEFRIYWVTPGRYYLKAGGGDDRSGVAAMIALTGGLGMGGGNPNEVPPAVSSAFFPGVPDAAGARIVEIGYGGDVAGVDWVLPSEAPGHRVRGRLIDARTGKPPAQAMVTIMPVSGGLAVPSFPGAFGVEEMFGFGGPSRQYNPSTGVLEFPNVKPGVYEITAVAQEMPGGDIAARALRYELGGIPGREMTPPTVVSGTTTVTVEDGNVEDVLVTVAPTGSLTGRLRWDGEPPPAPAGRGAGLGGAGGAGFGGPVGMPLSVQLISLRQTSPLSAYGGYGYDYYGGGVSGRPNADGVFRLNNVAPGEYRVQVQMPQNAYLKSAVINGVDILDSPLVVTGIAAGNLEIVVSSSSGKIQGTLVDDRGEPAPVMQVVLVPNRSRGRADLYKTAVTDAEGRFNFAGVAPGDYKVFAWQSIDPFGWFDPEVLERSESRGSPVRVSESAVENVAVRVIPAGGAQ
jgi:hypothetical protein